MADLPVLHPDAPLELTSETVQQYLRDLVEMIDATLPEMGGAEPDRAGREDLEIRLSGVCQRLHGAITARRYSNTTSAGSEEDEHGSLRTDAATSAPAAPAPSSSAALQALAELIDQEWIASCLGQTGEDPGATAVRAMADPMNRAIVTAAVIEAGVFERPTYEYFGRTWHPALYPEQRCGEDDDLSPIRPASAKMTVDRDAIPLYRAVGEA